MSAVLEAPTSQTAVAKIDLKAMALSRFGEWRPEAEAIVAKYKGVLFDATTPKGYKSLTEAIAEVRAPRYLAQNVSKASKSELAAVSKAVGAEESAIAAFLAETEAELVAQKEAEDERRAAEERRAREIEEARVAGHRARITAIYQCAIKAQGLPSVRIANGITAVEALVTDEATYQEFAREAADAKVETLATMRGLFATAKAAEDEVTAREAQRAEQARVAEEQRAEAARLSEARAMIEKAEREHAERMAAERAEIERQRAELAKLNTPQEAPQQVLKAEAATPDATDRAATSLSPSVGSMGAEQPADAGLTLAPPVKLGDICARLGFDLRSSFITDTLGIQPCGTDKRAILFAAADVQRIIAALIHHLQTI